MSVWTLTERPLGEQIEVLEGGLPSSALGEIATGRAPLEMLATDLGAQKVETLLRAMIHGVPV